MVMTWPLTHPPSSDARKATTRATSSASAVLPSGQFSAMRVSILSAGKSGPAPEMKLATFYLISKLDHDLPGI